MKARLAFILLAWSAAFLIVMLLFLVVPQVKDLPLALRAVAISGVLSITMTQLAIPLIQRLLRSAGRRGLLGPPTTRESRTPP
jgi:antibiotic biosynthesis monooxygenase (ABM) superfamily enzyme